MLIGDGGGGGVLGSRSDESRERGAHAGASLVSESPDLTPYTSEPAVNAQDKITFKSLCCRKIKTQSQYSSQLGFFTYKLGILILSPLNCRGD